MSYFVATILKFATSGVAGANSI